jgi:hypothetical protein
VGARSGDASNTNGEAFSGLRRSAIAYFAIVILICYGFQAIFLWLARNASMRCDIASFLYRSETFFGCAEMRIIDSDGWMQCKICVHG